MNILHRRLVGCRLVMACLICIAVLPPALAWSPQGLEHSAGLPTSRIAEGIYDVYATRVGLVGSRTSSGHIIVENDFFVALPACTPANCPNGPTRGNLTMCGSLCYVKVVNPVTNQCRVEPIHDLGPWFTVDDWWSPTHLRHLNSLPSNPLVLPQGYAAADAARDGLDVGFGRDATGIGFDNTGQIPGRAIRAVGNPAAIDLADGTWRNLGLEARDTIGTRVVVHLLWQTGEHPSSEAARCGHPLDQPGGPMAALPDPDATPVPGEIDPATPTGQFADSHAASHAGGEPEGNRRPGKNLRLTGPRARRIGRTLVVRAGSVRVFMPTVAGDVESGA